MRTTELLIIGAGPYGLSAAAYAKHLGIDFHLLGEPMGFWKRHMPAGMFLRSPTGWHLDPTGVNTFEAYLEERGFRPEDVSPIPLGLFLEYAVWFQERAALEVEPSMVRELRHADGTFEAELDNGDLVRAGNVLATPGLGDFPNLPNDLVAQIPDARYCHSSRLVSFEAFQGQRCLIIGGRQSAFEWGALISEAGAEAVDIVYRHETPSLVESDWSWVDELIRASIETRGWFRLLDRAGQAQVRQRLWTEGRLKLEPWLEDRIRAGNITLRPRSMVVEFQETGAEGLTAKLDSGETLGVDTVVLATGYDVDVTRVPYLSPTDIVPRLRVADGYPVLDDDAQSSVPGLYFTGPVATRDFGPFWGFVVGTPAAARIAIDGIVRREG